MVNLVRGTPVTSVSVAVDPSSSGSGSIDFNPLPDSMRGLVKLFSKSFLPVLCAGFTASACRSDQLVKSSNQRTDTFDQSTRAQSDILWVIDDSGSMAREQDQLAASFPKFFAYLQSAQLDYRIGVTTTDTITFPAQAGDLCQSGVCDVSSATVGSPAVIVGNSTDPKVPNTLNPQAAFAQNIHVGTNGSARDEALEAAATAIQKLQTQAGDAEDAGQPVLFLRPTAALFLVFVGDGIDYSPDYALDGVQYYWRDYLQAKGIGNNGLVQVAAIAGIPPAGCYPQICTNGVATGVDTDAGLTPFGERYYELVELAGGENVFGSICDCNFDQTLQELGVEALALTHKFRLSVPPDPATITVVVDYPCSTPDPVDNLICDPLRSTCAAGYGDQCDAGCSTQGLLCTVPSADPDAGATDGWTYNPADNSITFSDSTLPAAATQITVSYTAETSS